jgi:hypothetical protein
MTPVADPPVDCNVSALSVNADDEERIRNDIFISI